MKILVTGSSGHLGEALIRELRKTADQPVGIDLNPSEFTTHIGSITDQAFVNSVAKEADFIIHTATLHKPHVATHTYQNFVDVNVKGTLNLLEAAVSNNIKAFIYTSTTSTFGDILTPQLNEPAVWVTEQTPSIPKNIYGVTKNAAEDLCQLFYRNHKLPGIILKTSRFFPEEDDKQELRDAYEDVNLRANELLYRRVDLEDAVSAHLLAIQQAERIGFAKYIISATSPFQDQHLPRLNTDAISVVRELYPDFGITYQQKGWKMNPQIDRVYVNKKARTELGWQPKYDFRHVLDCLKKGKDFCSLLAKAVGVKGYHPQKFTEGPYPVTDY